ncbi:Fe/S biogenesis protein NfuA [Striga asiatica]|uniref:Fe/S biogenesis protein NfuA n=1 Tax=Striga asiatica TaxID=4170 RepID=A0A5A7QA02_STRAF|nr:Fe/S biogenesis protein NfuA [Striga asiatica]
MVLKCSVCRKKVHNARGCPLVKERRDTSSGLDIPPLNEEIQTLPRKGSKRNSSGLTSFEQPEKVSKNQMEVKHKDPQIELMSNLEDQNLHAIYWFNGGAFYIGVNGLTAQFPRRRLEGLTAERPESERSTIDGVLSGSGGEHVRLLGVDRAGIAILRCEVTLSDFPYETCGLYDDDLDC